MVEARRAHANLEPVLVDHDGAPIASTRTRPALSPKIIRAVLLRDGHCRWPGCTLRTGLQVNHLWPRSWGGRDDLANLAAACVGGGTDHHPKLAPHGPYLLIGNPNRPDGLRLVHRDQLAELADPAGSAQRGEPAEPGIRAGSPDDTPAGDDTDGEQPGGDSTLTTEECPWIEDG